MIPREILKRIRPIEIPTNRIVTASLAMAGAVRRWALMFAALLALHLGAAETNLVTLVTTIPLPDVRGRIDHFALDARGQRLFVAALGNDTVEVLDVAGNKKLRRITGCSSPQGLAYVPGLNRLFIANGGRGVVQMREGDTFQVLQSVGDLPDADNVRYDGRSGLIYVGYGDGGLAVIGATNGALVARIKLAGHPESFQLEENGNRIFVNVPEARQIAVVDRDKRGVIATWPMGKFHSNFPMALDEVNHRLFVGCRQPARLVVLDTTSGKQVGDLDIPSDIDDVFYDASRKQLYASCGGGFIDVIDQRAADSYALRERISTVSGARTSYYSPARNELFLAVRAGWLSGSAEVRVYRTH